MKTWRLRPGLDRRFKAGHPWVYSNELSESPKGIEPGEAIELRDQAGKFLARGYGHPGSLIAFRTVSRDEAEAEPLSRKGLLERLKTARRFRESLGFANTSYRLCFAEADRLPGVIIDRYRLNNSPVTQCFAVQLQTAGADCLREPLIGALEELCGEEWKNTVVVLRNDIGIRKLDGLEDQSPLVVKNVPGVALEDAAFLVWRSGEESALFRADLLNGQKTGFFLDQTANVGLATSRLLPRFEGRRDTIRVLDLCCYVGQWGSSFARSLKARGYSVHVTGVDASASALAFAARNVESAGASFEAVKGDVLRDLEALPSASYDVVISDPPAFIKGRKDLPTGTHAYLQLNTQAFRVLKRGGGVVSCSCSALMNEDDFLQTVAKAARRNGVFAQWVGRGSQAPDHPVLAEFPEGRYLKGWVGAI
jgi:23S rRNA (cytosine1962-C5)-methyltransferase